MFYVLFFVAFLDNHILENIASRLLKETFIEDTRLKTMASNSLSLDRIWSLDRICRIPW